MYSSAIPFIACRWYSTLAINSSTLGQIWGGNNNANVLQCSPVNMSTADFTSVLFWWSHKERKRRGEPLTLFSISLLIRFLKCFTKRLKIQLRTNENAGFIPWHQHHSSVSLSPPLWGSLYLAPPWNRTSTSPTWATQLALETDKWPSASLPSSTTEVTSTPSMAMSNDPLSCLEKKPTVRTNQCNVGYGENQVWTATETFCRVCVYHICIIHDTWLYIFLIIPATYSDFLLANPYFLFYLFFYFQYILIVIYRHWHINNSRNSWPNDTRESGVRKVTSRIKTTKCCLSSVVYNQKSF